jgi:hypothetical protein
LIFHTFLSLTVYLFVTVLPTDGIAALTIGSRPDFYLGELGRSAAAKYLLRNAENDDSQRLRSAAHG